VTVASLVLIVVAVVLLGYGLLDGSNTYLVGSILASLLAALALVVGSRRGDGRAAVAAAVEAEQAEQARSRRRPARDEELVGAGARGSGGGRGAAPVDDYDEYDDEIPTRDTELIDLGARGGVPAQSDARSAPVDERTGREFPADEDDEYDEYDDDDEDEADEDDPEDEPLPQRVSAADAARVAQLDTDVLVCDGRPRYHLPGCVHLLGRDNEPLPVSEAVELGFTPCSLCEPDSALLARARRV
jgi:hypothetical protein